MSSDRKKRVGRFIKKDSRVLKKLSLSEFSFEEINEDVRVTHDNEDGSIIHQKFHDPENINSALKSPNNFDEDVRPESQRRPILRPMDFTQDWEAQKQRQKKKNRDEDEELDFDFNAFQVGSHGRSESESGAEKPPEDHDPSTPVGEEQESPHTPATTTDEEDDDGEDAVGRRAAMNTVSEAIQSLHHPGEGDSAGAPSEGEQAEHPPPHGPVHVRSEAIEPEAPQTPSEQAEPSETAQADDSSSESFIPDDTQGAFEAPHDPEAAAAEAYKQQVEQSREENAEALEQAFEDAKARGYQDGFRHGEEKAETQFREQASQMFGKLGELIEEFSQLKGTILNNVQENFYELCQAVAESLLEREFQIDPSAFGKVIQKAIADSVEDDEFKIHVAPEAYDQLSSLDDPHITQNLVRDSELSGIDFRIDSKLSSVEGDVRGLVQKLLEDADVNLFDETTEGRAG